MYLCCGSLSTRIWRAELCQLIDHTVPIARQQKSTGLQAHTRRKYNLQETAG